MQKRPSRVSRGKKGCIIADWILLSKYPFGVKLGHTRIGMITDPGWAGQGMGRGGCVFGYRYQMDREHFAFKIRKKKKNQEREKTSARRRLGLRGINDYRPHPLSLSFPPVIAVCMRVRMCLCRRRDVAEQPLPTVASHRAQARQGIHPWVAPLSYIPISGAKRF